MCAVYEFRQRDPEGRVRTDKLAKCQQRAFLVKLTPVMRNSGWHALQAESSVPGYVEQALAGSDPKLIL